MTLDQLNAGQVPLPRYWVNRDEVGQRLAGRWTRTWLLGWRDICRSTDERTCIATIIPAVGAGGIHIVFVSEDHARLAGVLLTNLCAFVFDWCARLKVGGTHLAFFTMEQLPVLAPDGYSNPCRWASGHALADWITPRIVELVSTSRDLAGFAADMGLPGEPFRWDEQRRRAIRAELDAAYFHLYGLGRVDVDHVMDSFPIVRRRDEAAYGEYRTKNAILRIYDAMAEAIRTGRPYETILDPPPAHPSLRHPAATVPPVRPIESGSAYA